MSLREVARFTDVYEADLAAAFLASHGLEVSVTERFQTTVDPLMQRALGIRLMAPASVVQEARELLARVQSGEFATAEGDDLQEIDTGTRVGGTLLALVGGFWGNSLPRRFRPVAWQGILLSMVVFVAGGFVVLAAAKLFLDPP